ncbi:hypothetical protein [Nocardiopsis suaedae]|uniref:Uncharacterized protein n=1 Tax=Nocardiopsis suaedae TaxID=3018444 RepID=A0ABT4TI71_9ACTN|nr:hypothetical protein [Nocardiopsis suaedae]MDA2804398.1 hypothetical protein [Nocardiopsis suaedae]
MLGLAVLLAAVSGAARSEGPFDIPGADDLSWLTEEPAAFPPDPPGWQRHTAADISYAVPGDWVPVPEGDLKDGYAASWHAPDGGTAIGELSVLDYPDAGTDAYRALVDASSLLRSEKLDLPLAGNEGCWEYDFFDFYLNGACDFPAAYVDPESGRRIHGMTGVYYAVQVERDSAPVIVRVLLVEDSDFTVPDLLDAVRPAYAGLIR